MIPVDVAALKERIGNRVVVASVSGGKDSAAMCLYLQELGIEHRRVFADTGWEHARTYDYLRGELTRVLGPIEEVRGELLMKDLVRKKGMFPSRARRFCTEDLKVRPLAAYHRAIDGETINAVGIRAAESAARAKFVEWEYSETFDGDCWRPLLRWSEEDVIAIHKRHELAPNPLYLAGASRVGCWPCIAARKEEIRIVAMTDPKRIDEIEALEDEVTEAAHARACDKAGGPVLLKRRALFQVDRAHRTDSGTFESWPIREVVEWSMTARGGRQGDMFARLPRTGNEGCARWGMCEQVPDPKEAAE